MRHKYSIYTTERFASTLEKRLMVTKAEQINDFTTNIRIFMRPYAQIANYNF